MNGLTPTWVGHLVLAAAMVVMAWNVAAYSLLFKGQVLRTDFFYMLTALTFVCILYGGVLLLSGASYSFGLLNVMAITLSIAVLSHAFVDLGRRVLDLLFFGGDVRRLRDDFPGMLRRTVAPKIGCPRGGSPRRAQRRICRTVCAAS